MSSSNLHVSVSSNLPPSRSNSPISFSLLHDRSSHPLNVLCILPSITRGFRPNNSLSSRSPVTRRVSLLNDNRVPPQQTEQERLKIRREMIAALADSGNSLSPGRRSSITTLMPTTGLYVDEVKVGGMGNGQADAATGVSRESTFKPTVNRSNTNQHTIPSTRTSNPAMTTSESYNISGSSTIPSSPSPPAPPTFGSRSKSAVPSSVPVRRNDRVNGGTGNSSESDSTGKVMRSRPQTSHVASGSSTSKFGTKPSGGRGGAESDSESNSSAAMGGGSNSGGGGMTGKMSGSSISIGNSWNGNGRPGWEGEEIVNVLRQDGIQVTTLRSASQIGPHLRTMTSMPPAISTISSNISGQGTSSSSSTSNPIQVVLVPLSDSPTLPSLSLLLSQGTTPSAVCFQQDLLDRARRTEADWLPSALDMIQVAVDPVGSGHTPHPETTFVIAYSANPALSESVVVRCMHSGAIGVLQPPYESVDTIERIDQLMRNHMRVLKETSKDSKAWSRRTSVAAPNSSDQVEEDGSAHTAVSAVEDTEHTDSFHVVDTPNDYHNTSIPPLSRLSSTPNSATPRRDPSPRSFPQNASHPPSSVTPTIIGGSSSHGPGRMNDPMKLFGYEFDVRRRSVDTGGLALALERATKALCGENGIEQSNSVDGDWSQRPPLMSRASVSTPGADPRNPLNDSGETWRSPNDPMSGPSGKGAGLAPVSKVISLDDDEDGNETVLAELLGEMYRQTKIAIEITMVDYPNFAAPLEPDHRQRLLAQLSSWHFKPHVLDEGDLFRCACILFDAILRIDGLAQLGIPRDQMNRFLFAVRAIYHAPNPYHNYVHAIDVLQASYTFLVAIGVAPPFPFLLEDGVEPWMRPELPVEKDGPDANARRKVLELMRPQEVLCLMIAAMGHDVGHPGLSNAFMKNAKTPLSQLYDDKSVLENMHCTLIVQLMRKHGFSFLLDSQQSRQADPSPATPLSATFPNIPPTMAPLPHDPAPGAITDWRGFRKNLYATVVATDMSLHFSWIHQFRLLGKRVRESPEELAEEPQDDIPTVEEDRIMLCQAIIKCADISNPARPIDVSEHWSSVLLEEWAIQADLEQRLALPVSVISSASAALQARGQIGFIDLFTAPLFEAASEAMPVMQCYSMQCINNRALWQARLEAAQAAADGASPQSAIRTVQLPTEMSEDDRFKTIFPLSLPASLLLPLNTPTHQNEELSPRNSSADFAGSTMSSIPSSRPRPDPASQAVRVAYKASIKRQPSSQRIELEPKRMMSIIAANAVS